MTNHYAILGVPHQASKSEITRAYRQLATRLHPDHTGKDTSKAFHQVREAYETLKKPELRQIYDQILKQKPQPRPQSQTSQKKTVKPKAAEKVAPASHKEKKQDNRKPTKPKAQAKPSAPQQSPKDNRAKNTQVPPAHFNHKFSSSAAPSAQQEGGWSQEKSAGADFADVFKTVFNRQAKQPANGKIRGADIRVRVPVNLEKIFHGGSQKVRIPEDNTGVSESRVVAVNIPVGCRNGWETTIPGHGHPGHGGGVSGALQVQFYYKDHDVFQVSGKDIYLTLPLEAWEVALGTQIEVPTLGGNFNVQIPSGVRSGSKLKLKGQGIPGKPPGDQLLLLEIRVPTATSRIEKQSYEALSKLPSPKDRFAKKTRFI